MQLNRTLHQIFLSSCSDEKLPSVLQNASAEAKSFFASCGYEHRLWGNHEVSDFLFDCFGSEVLNVYQKLKPLAYKADLARYCIVYHFGGWYADITLKFIQKVLIQDDIEFVYFHDFGSGPPAPSSFLAGCQNSFFFAKAKHPALGKAINSVVKNCYEGFYGFNSTCPTGPILFGKSIIDFTPSPFIVPGYFMSLTPGHVKKNLAYVMPTGEIVAFHKSTWFHSAPPGGDISCFGVKGSNNYNELWKSKDIYC